jgi:hypothetical protein
MTAVAATEFAEAFGRYKEETQREPVAITSYGWVSGYFVCLHASMRNCSASEHSSAAFSGSRACRWKSLWWRTRDQCAL